MARYVEKYDRANLEKLVNITHEDMESIWKRTDNDIKGENTDIKTQTLLIRKLCREALKNGGSREVVYKYSKKLGDKGRLYADGPSLQNIKKTFRGLLSYSSAVDFDAINCHPVLLHNLCVKHNLPCYELAAYVSQRADRIREFCEIDNLTPAEAKAFFLSSFNKDTKIVKKDKRSNIKNQAFLRYDNEIKTIQAALVKLFPDEYKSVRRSESANVTGKFTARILNIEEGKMLNAACEAIQDQYTPMTLAFDGVMVEKYDKSGAPIDEEAIIEKLNNATSEWSIKWDVKEPDLTLQEFADHLKTQSNVMLYAGTETELCKSVYEHFFEGKFYKRDGVHYLLHQNQWLTSENTIQDHVTRTVMDCYGYVEKTSKDGSVSQQLLTQSMGGANSITKMIMTIVPENKRFINDAEKRAAYHISFENGYWDYRKDAFITYNQNPEYDTINKIERDFTYMPEGHPKRQEVFERIFYKMFACSPDDKEDPHYRAMENFLHEMGLVFAGIVQQKRWYVMRGERDSCKGVFDLLMRNAFGSYVGSFNSSSFALDTKNQQDPELQQKFLLKNRHARIATAQEAPGCWLDGNLIKKVSSGGDTIDARNLFKNTESFQNVCKYMWLLNDEPRIKPVDALKTRWGYQMTSQFVDNPDKVSPKMRGVKYYKRDDDIKQVFCNDPEVLNAFCSIVFDYYKRTDTSFPDELRELGEANQDPVSEAHRLFKFGGAGNVVTNTELKQIYNENKDSFDSLLHMKRILKQLGADEFKSGGIRGLKGLTVNLAVDDEEVKLEVKSIEGDKVVYGEEYGVVADSDESFD